VVQERLVLVVQLVRAVLRDLRDQREHQVQLDPRGQLEQRVPLVLRDQQEEPAQLDLAVQLAVRELLDLSV